MMDLKKIIKEKVEITTTGQCEIELNKNEIYYIDDTIHLAKPVCIKGNGAYIENKADRGITVLSSDVKITDLTISGGMISVLIDNKGKKIKNIVIENCQLEKYLLSGLVIGASEGYGETKGVSLKNCTLSAETMKKEDGTENVMALDILMTAGLSEETSIENAVLTDVCIEHCMIKGHSICNIMSVPGLSLNPENIPLFRRCAIKNVSITNSTLTGSDDTVFAAQANYINNEECYCENFAAKNNQIEFGLTGLSASAGSPMTGSVEKIYFKNIDFSNNRLTGKKDVGETRTAIGIGAGGIDYKPASCNRCGIEGIKIEENIITDCERGIKVSAGYSMIDADAPSELIGNYVKRTMIRNNKLKDVQFCFIFYAAWIEGRRFDWNWGAHHTTQTWLPPVTDHTKTTVIASENRIEDLVCENNKCDGFSYLLCASAARARGHGRVLKNALCGNIIFRNNAVSNGENHVRINTTILEDWAADGGENLLERDCIQI